MEETKETEATRELATSNQGKEMDLSHLGMGHITTLAQTFYTSGVFTDVKSEAQAMVKVLAGQELGLPPIYSMQNFHLITVTNQKTGEQRTSLAMAAETMGLLLKRTGKYDYEVTKHDENECVIEFSELKAGEWKLIYTSRFTKQDAVRAGIWRAGGAWEKFPRAMNFSRSMSQGCRIVGPDVMTGPKYTVEEVESITPDILGETEGPPEPDRRRRRHETKKVAEAPRITEQEEAAAPETAVVTQTAIVETPPPSEPSPAAEKPAEKPSEAPEIAPAAAETTTAPPTRDPKTVKTLQEFYRACADDFGLGPDKVMAELGVEKNMQIVKTPWECYLQIAAVHRLKNPPVALASTETQ